MLNYKHILLAIDFSTASQSLIKTTINLQQRCQAQVSIVHVLEYSSAVFGEGEFSIPLDVKLQEQLTTQAESALSKIGTQLNVPKNKQFLLHGSVKKEIIELSKKISADLIVIGRHGHHGIDTLLGSTANAILHTAQCDVLAIKITNVGKK